MTTINDYRQLIVWQKAMDLVEMIYRTTGVFPREEVYTLTSQMRPRCHLNSVQHRRRERSKHHT